jgi:hypothetical protein
MTRFYRSAIPRHNLICGSDSEPVYHQQNPAVSRGGRNSMKSSTKDQAEGKLNKALDKVKDASRESTGKLGKDPRLEAEEKDEKATVKDKEDLGQIERF